jgi:pimeloyl-ACP methyl ester carboxylesterase
VSTTTTSSHTEQRISVANRAIRIIRGGTGQPLVTLHHSTGSLGWLPLHDALASKFDVLVPDLPGYGQSERPEWARAPRDIAILMNQAFEQLGLSSISLVGFGFGGFIAAELATMDPSRLASLTLIGAAGLKPREGEIMDEMLTGYVEYMEAGFRDKAHYVQVFGEEPEASVRELWDFSREMTARICWKPFMFSNQLPHLLGGVPTRTLLIWGSQDRVVPPVCGTQYKEAMPNARLEVLQGAGHYVEYEETSRVADLISAHARGS